MSRWPPYPAYKDSGVEWLGEIPVHWEMRRLKYTAPESSTKLSEKPQDALYLGLENIEPKTGRLLLENTVEDVESTVIVFRKGDILFGKLRPYLAKVVYIDFDGVGTTELLVLRPKESVDGRFLFYYLLADGFIDDVNSQTYGTKMPRANSEQIGNQSCSLPPLPEQRAIAAFLDTHTTRLDAAIAEQRRLIDLLREKRAALISRAVTQGLDPTVPMKDSGVEWLGEIPSHWEIKRLRFVCELNPSKSEVADLSPDTQVSFLPMEKVNEDGTFSLDETRTVEQVWQGYTYFRDQDVVVAKITPCFENGKGAVFEGLVNGVGFGTTEFHVLRANQDTDPRFIFYLTRSNSFRQLGVMSMYGVAGQQRVPQEFLANFVTGFPLLLEQRAIAAHLDRETARLDAAAAEIETSIAHLEEYRAALIAAAVTGQIDVRQ